jgi:hypothetical protein
LDRGNGVVGSGYGGFLKNLGLIDESDTALKPWKKVLKSVK